MIYKKIQLRRGKEESLKRFHPWVFSGAIQRMDDGIQEGELVRVVTNEAISSLWVITSKALLPSVS